jgi:hypothetical protein
MSRRSHRTRRVYLVVGAVASVAFVSATRGDPVNTIWNGGYHAQVTDYFCAAASMEMELDVAAVKPGNVAVQSIVGAGDGAPVAHGAAPPAVTIVNQGGIGLVTAGGQSYIYGLVHGQNTFNGQTYFNPFSPPGVGTGNTAVAAGLNLIDNPNVNGTTGPAVGNHVYAAYNLTNQALASRTIANALKSVQIPAVAAINRGTHAISVYGVQTDVNPVMNANYKINGFFVHDPWTGYAFARKRAGDNLPVNLGGYGLGCNTYLRNGYDNVPGMKPIDLPDGTQKQVRLGAWLNYFNSAPPQAGEGPVMSTFGHKFEVEPIGPELPDDGNGGQFFSLPDPPAELAAEDNALQARSDAMNDLAANAILGSEPGFVGGGFDATTSDEMLLQTPDDITGQGDWVVPYDGPGGVNDITAVVIDAHTGVIDMATWIDPSDPNQVHMTLGELDSMLTDDIQTGLLPNDNPLPEPGAALVAVIGVANLLRRRRS